MRNNTNRHIISSGKLLIVLGISFLLNSCQKFTELSPLDAFSESTAFEDPERVELVANGVYEKAAVGQYDPGTGLVAGRGYPFGGASIQQAEMRGEDMINLQQFYAFTYQSTYSTTSANNVNHWEQLYALINQANILIEGVRTAGQNGILDQEIANRYEGEGRFLRALAHHELLLHFSRPYADGNGDKVGIPYRDKATSTPEAVDEGISLGRGTVQESYNKILDDLDWAEQNLPAIHARGISRANKGAAIALKTRVKLHMKDWDGVIDEGTKLGTASAPFSSPIGNFKLETDPSTPFSNYSNNTESVFSIANSAASNGGSNGALPQMFGPASSSARGLVAISPNLYNASFWVTGDRRRSGLLVQQTTQDAEYFFTYKYREYATRSDWTPIIRYAEVLLNVAEAYARLDNTSSEAFNLLNAVRDRSVPEDQKFTTAPADLILAILNERRVEFCAEGRRWPDIHRLALDATYGTGGIPAKINPTQLAGDGTDYDVTSRPMLVPARAAIEYSDYRFLWPIPASEINRNPTLKDQQNPNY